MIKIVDSSDASKAQEIESEVTMAACPFCGSGGIVTFYGPKHYMPGCSACPAEIHEHYLTPKEAVEAWNVRCEPKKKELPWPCSLFADMAQAAERALDSERKENPCQRF